MGRALDLYVRGLLAGRRAVPVRIAAPGIARAFADARGLHVPAAFPMYGAARAAGARFAAAAHLAAHVRFGQRPLARGRLRPIQVVLVSLFEDARVERLAAAELPGLGRAWASFHRATPADHPTFVALAARIAHALADDRYEDGHPLVAKARALFFHGDHDLSSADGCRRFGSLLGNDIGQTRLSFDPRTYLVDPPYRDDHRLLWEENELEEDAAAELEETPDESSEPEGAAPTPGARLDDSAAGGARPAELPMAAGDDDQRAVTGVPIRYPEWDYQIGVARPGWCTLHEEPPTLPQAPGPAAHGDVADARARLPSERAAAVARLARALRVEGLARRRREREGVDIDTDAAVEAEVERRLGRLPELRVYTRLERRRRGLAVLLLIDLSASTAAPVTRTERRGGGDRGAPDATTVIELACESALLLGDLLTAAGDPFAIHGFSSNGRHEVEYHRFKDLDTAWSARTRRCLARIAPRLSTRMGAALRHAGHILGAARRERRLILLLTDGEPADVDAPDPAYLLHDARHAVAEQRRNGVHVFAVSLDPRGDACARRIFGAGGYSVVDHIDRLPDTLPRIYARLSR